MILYALYVAAIFFPCHPYIWSTTVLHDKSFGGPRHGCLLLPSALARQLIQHLIQHRLSASVCVYKYLRSLRSRKYLCVPLAHSVQIKMKSVTSV